jgi:hypothetical protein
MVAAVMQEGLTRYPRNFTRTQQIQTEQTQTRP